jgi:hypothetical protein
MVNKHDTTGHPYQSEFGPSNSVITITIIDDFQDFNVNHFVFNASGLTTTMHSLTKTISPQTHTTNKHLLRITIHISSHLVP